MKNFLILFFLMANPVFAQVLIDLKIRQNEVSQNFYLVDVVDERENTEFIGKVISQNSFKKQNLKIKKDLNSAFQTCFKGNQQSVNQIQIGIKNFELFEETKDSKRINGNFWMTINFYRLKEGAKIELTEYTFTSKYTRAFNKFEDVPPILSNGIFKSFQYFDNWVLKNLQKSEGLANKVKVIVKKSNKSHEDTIYYNPNSRITWSDFKGKPGRNLNFGAAIFSSFGFDCKAKVLNGEIVLEADVFTYMVPNMSWVKSDSKTQYALEHERAHFDITKLISEEFKSTLKSTTFSTIDWESEIRYMYLEYFQKLNKIQEKYDSETEHGLNKDSQFEWLEKIKLKLENIQ